MRKYIMGVVIGVIVLFVLFVVARALVPQISSRPTDLGVTDGQLKACPQTPNCVSSQAPESDSTHYMAPITYTTTTEDAKSRILNIINNMERSAIITEEPNYIHAEFRSLVWGFIDDTEFYFDEANNLIHFRSAARLGRSDLGVNRSRMEEIREQFRAG